MSCVYALQQAEVAPGVPQQQVVLLSPMSPAATSAASPSTNSPAAFTEQPARQHRRSTSAATALAPHTHVHARAHTQPHAFAKPSWQHYTTCSSLPRSSSIECLPQHLRAESSFPTDVADPGDSPPLSPRSQAALTHMTSGQLQPPAPMDPSSPQPPRHMRPRCNSSSGSMAPPPPPSSGGRRGQPLLGHQGSSSLVCTAGGHAASPRSGMHLLPEVPLGALVGPCEPAVVVGDVGLYDDLDLNMFLDMDDLTQSVLLPGPQAPQAGGQQQEQQLLHEARGYPGGPLGTEAGPGAAAGLHQLRSRLQQYEAQLQAQHKELQDLQAKLDTATTATRPAPHPSSAEVRSARVLRKGVGGQVWQRGGGMWQMGPSV